MEHGGLFTSWAPYSDAETFTYHFGFHAITATFGWLTGLPAWSSVFIMGRVIGAATAASLFALVRLWTRSPWGGVFAAACWLVSSSYLYPFETMGRWTLLAGLACLTSNLVLFSSYLRTRSIRDRVWFGATCGVTAAGLVLTQYKSAIICAALCLTLITARCLTRLLNRRAGKGPDLLSILLRAAAVAGIALLLAGPRLNTVMHARSGRYLKRIVIEAPAAASNQYDQPTLSGAEILQSGFGTPRKATVSALALFGAALALLWRRRAVWFFAGWILITLLMNPRLVGSSRLGIIDQAHWSLAVEFAVAAMAGLTIGIFAEFRSRKHWAAQTIVPVALLAALIILSARNLPPVFDSVRYVLRDDLRLMEWIAHDVPAGEMIAGRGYFDHGEVLGRDAMMWLPHFTRHRTNHTNLAAGLERGPAELRARLRDFTTHLYARDMSTPESARWMEEQGFRWFYVGTLELNQDVTLLDQLARNPGLEVARTEGPARIYRIR
jgi:uncharacterized protein DUF6541